MHQSQRFVAAPGISRRGFIKNSAIAMSAAAAAQMAFPSGVHAAGSGTLRVGLVGCGQRGGGAASNALNADRNTRLVAMGDVFEQPLKARVNRFQESAELGDRVEVPADNQFVGFDAYKGVIEKSDVVLLATPPAFRAQHLKACIDAGKHVFCEKPVGVDVPSVMSVLDSCRRAADKGLSVVSGHCHRYDTSKMDIVKRVHDGQIGDIMFLQTNFLTRSKPPVPRKPGASDMEHQLRNWIFYLWLCGDFIVEQHVHGLDKMLWAMNEQPPAKVFAMGGRAWRTGPEYGNIYDLFASNFDWDNGLRCSANCRQIVNAANEITDHIIGSKGKAELMSYVITGEKPYQAKRPRINMYDYEHRVLMKSIQKNEPVNDGQIMANATLMAIMARMSAYTGETIYWDKAAAEKHGKNVKPEHILMESKERIGPETYEWGKVPVTPVAVPGGRY